MKRYIDIDTWNRKEHFLFFGSFTDPFFGVTVNIDFTTTYNKAKADNESFYLYSLYEIMRTVNEIEEFRFRVENQDVICCNTIHISTTIGREDGSFGFGFFEYSADKKQFLLNGKAEIERIQSLTGLCVDDNGSRPDIIRFSPVPWLKFTEMKHATSFPKGDSVPRISTGKLFKENGKLMMPVSIVAHHGLMDGKHIALFIDQLSSFIEE